MTVTSALADPEPPGPLQTSVSVAFVVNGPTLVWVPEVARVPLQPPEAVQESALVDDHVTASWREVDEDGELVYGVMDGDRTGVWLTKRVP